MKNEKDAGGITADERAERVLSLQNTVMIDLFDQIRDQIGEAERAANRARDLEWSKAAGLMSAQFGKATTPEEYAEYVKDAKQIERVGAEKMRERCAVVLDETYGDWPVQQVVERVAAKIRALPLEDVK